MCLCAFVHKKKPHVRLMFEQVRGKPSLPRDSYMLFLIRFVSVFRLIYSITSKKDSTQMADWCDNCFYVRYLVVSINWINRFDVELISKLRFTIVFRIVIMNQHYDARISCYHMKDWNGEEKQKKNQRSCLDIEFYNSYMQQ